MPKRRKNKKKRKDNGRKAKNQKISNSALLTTDDVMRTCFDDDSFNRSRPVSPLELRTPLNTPYPKSQNTDPFDDELSPMGTTPVNRKRSLNAMERKKYRSMNVTNLNILFDSNLSENISKSKSDININNSVNTYKKRSNSSNPKLHSPTVENSHILQENQNKMLELSKTNEILETPRVSKVLLKKSGGEYNVSSLNNYKPVDDKVNNNQNIKLYNGEVNINPYLNNREINVLNKDGSFGEISFFSPNLFQHKSSSTPIEKQHQTNNLINYVKDSLKKDNVNECIDVSEIINLPNNPSTIPNMETNVNLNKTPLSENVLNNQSMKSFRQPVSLNKRKSYRTSPSSCKVLTQSRIFNNRRYSYTYSRLNISRRSSVDSVETASRHSRSGIGEKLLTKLKKYTKVSQRWSMKVMEMCTHLGVQLKNSLSSVCNLYSEKSMLLDSDKPVCKCDEYRDEISQLNLKILELSEEVRTIKLQLDHERTNKENIEILNQELNKVREELSQFKDLRTEMESVKEQLKCLKPTSVQSSISIPPPPPLPSVPPPPPPPPLPLSMPDCSTVKILKKTKAKSISTDNSRPIISLDDILKVKLKKTSERASSLTPMTRQLSQPVISRDMLRQVKLRPASRPSFRPDTPDTGVSTSPHSSLCRLLNNDGPMFRLKRLRKVGRYSFDSVHRRNLDGKRERDGS